MAILCLARDFADLKQRLGDIVVGYNVAQQPVTARQLQADGAMAALLRDAVKPNLVQTLEGTLALIHGGPFANIAHGCSSVIAIHCRMKLADYVVTEAGFGADLGAEKFLDIKCRASGLRPHCAVVVATIRALKYHGGASLDSLNREDLVSLQAGLPNLLKHVANLSEAFGLRCVVALNHRTHDTDAEVELLREKLAAYDTPVVVARHWAQGGEGAIDLAHAVVEAAADRGADVACFTRTTCPCGTSWRRWHGASTALPRSSGTGRCAPASTSCRRQDTATCRSASPRPSRRSPATRRCAAPPTATP